MTIFSSDNNEFCPNTSRSPIHENFDLNRTVSTSLNQRTVLSQSAYSFLPFQLSDSINVPDRYDIDSQISDQDSEGHLAYYDPDDSFHYGYQENDHDDFLFQDEYDGGSDEYDDEYYLDYEPY